MADLVTTEDIEARLGRSLTTDELDRIDALIADASSNVIGYTGQEFAPSESTQRLKVRQGFVLLPQRPVTAVDTVTDHLGNELTFTWDEIDRVYLRSQVPDTFAWVPYLRPLSLVDVTYTHGYETVPQDIIGVVCGIVLRSLGQAPTDGGVVSETIDDYTYRLGSTGAAGAFGFLPAERAVLDRYRRVGGTVALAVGLG